MGRELRLGLPESARIHIPVHWTVGLTIDGTMPIGHRWPTIESGPTGTQGTAAASPAETGQKLTFPFVIIENADGSGACLEVSSRFPDESWSDNKTGVDYPFAVKHRKPTVVVERTASGFTLYFYSMTEAPVESRNVASIEEAADFHAQWLRHAYGVLPIDERQADHTAPEWASDIPVAFTFDMWLANGEVAHNYIHLRDFVRELAGIGVPPGVVFYIPGWCGPYDGRYPDYEPVPELGGQSAFRECVDAVHEAGYRIMIHTLGWGMDPYVPGFRRRSALALRNYADPADPPPPIVHDFQLKPFPEGAVTSAPGDDPLRGPYGGWPGGGEWFRLEYDSGRVPLHALSPGPCGWLFETDPLPERCEAVMEIGGFRRAGRAAVTVKVNGRSLTSPAGWFEEHESYTFPLTFLFVRGGNTVELTLFGAADNALGTGEGASADPEGAWYRIAEAYGHRRNIWTQPAVGADLDDPEWHKEFCRKLVPTVWEFGIDAVHVDATTMWKWNEAGLFAELRRRLPPGTGLGTEVATTAGLGCFALNQTRISQYMPNAGNENAGSGAGSDSASTWYPGISDLPWRITTRYTRFYPHLCTPTGFVPTASSCCVDAVPAALSDNRLQTLQRTLAFWEQNHVVPTLRVNYRDFGLDAHTRQYLESYFGSGDRRTR